MKHVLSILLAFVFIQTQCWALSGGPVYQNGILNSAIVGTYAGVLVPETVNRIFENPDFVGKANDQNTLGIFIVGVPDIGAATGNYLFFQDGEAYYGDITGLVDPGTLEFTALIAGAAATNNLGSGAEFFSPVSAVGKIEAKVSKPSNNAVQRFNGVAFFQLQGYAPDSSPSGSGFATLREVTFSVEGWKQSSQVENATLPPPNTISIPGPTPPPTP